MRILGLDVGSRTIGLAVSDPMGWTAQGLKTWPRKDGPQDLAEIKHLVQQYEVQKIVIGLPLNMNGTLGPAAREVEKWAEELKHALALEVVLWDERLSTVASERVLLEANVSRRKRKRVIDKMAAVFILQNYLDAQAGVPKE